MQIPHNKILHGDSIKVMKKLPGDSVDLVFADPPFNLQKKYDNTVDDLSGNEYLKWCYEWLDECIRILKPQAQCSYIIYQNGFIPFGSHYAATDDCDRKVILLWGKQT